MIHLNLNIKAKTTHPIGYIPRKLSVSYFDENNEPQHRIIPLKGKISYRTDMLYIILNLKHSGQDSLKQLYRMLFSGHVRLQVDPVRPLPADTDFNTEVDCASLFSGIISDSDDHCYVIKNKAIDIVRDRPGITRELNRSYQNVQLCLDNGLYEIILGYPKDNKPDFEELSDAIHQADKTAEERGLYHTVGWNGILVTLAEQHPDWHIQIFEPEVFCDIRSNSIET